MAANIRCIMRAKAPYGQGITKMKVKLTPEQSSTPSLMPETNSVFLRRATEGTGELMELVGGTVAWNQLFPARTSGTTTNDVVITISNGVYDFHGTASAAFNYNMDSSVVSFTAGHVYIIASRFDNDTGYRAAISGSASDGYGKTINNVGCIKPTVSSSEHLRMVVANGAVLNHVKATPYITDLTQMFNPTIADYVYSLEQQTAGSGIQWLKDYDLIDDEYHAYSAPTLQSVEATAHVTKDANNTTIATYPLDSDLVLRGIPKLTNGVLSYDGDTYEWDGTVRRWYAEVDMGSLSWEKVTNTTTTVGYSFRCTPSPTALMNSMNRICDKYVLADASGLADLVLKYGADVDKIMFKGANANVYVIDSAYADAASFTAAMSGHKLIYKMNNSVLDTPADPFTAVQTVEDGGTEEFVTTNGVPVGVVGRFANAVPMEGVDSFSVTANDGTSHTYPVTLSEEIYRGYVDMLTGDAVSDMASIAEYNGETINAPWLSSLDVYAPGATPTRGAQVVYPITPEEVTATITGDPSSLSGVVSATSTEGTVVWSELSEIGIKCIMKRKNPFQ